MAFEGNTWYTYLLYSLIVTIALIGNSLVLYILFTRPQYLKRSYNVFIFNLAATDILTAILLIFSRYLYLPAPPASGEDAKIGYCKFIWSAWLPFTLGYVSIYTCLALTAERWLAVNRPHLYVTLKAKHAVKVVAVVWAIGILVNLTTLFRVKYDNDKKKCIWTKLSHGHHGLSWMDFTLQSLIPFTLMIVLYSHIIYTLHKLQFTDTQENNPVRKVTIVALAASLALIVGWLPSRITFLLSKFGHVNPGSRLHFLLIMLAFFNSCVNPFLYGIYSSDFRKEYRSIFSDVVTRVGWNRTSSTKQGDIEMQGKTNKALDSQQETEITLKRSSLGAKIGLKIGR